MAERDDWQNLVMHNIACHRHILNYNLALAVDQTQSRLNARRSPFARTRVARWTRSKRGKKGLVGGEGDRQSGV